MTYVTYAQIEEQAAKHTLRYGSKASFRTIVGNLFLQGACQEGAAELPQGITWSSMSDTAFHDVLKRLPISNTSSRFTTPPPASKDPEPSISAEAIMPENLEVYAIKYIRNIAEKMHLHNFFEVDYVMSGKCKMIFENEIRELQAGDVCVIAPHSRHDVTIDDESVVISLMLRQSTFETTFFKLLAQEDLLSSFFRNILYSKKETANYMLFLTDNSEDLRNSVKDIFMESYISDPYSNTCIISRIHLFFSLLLRRYGKTIQFYDNQRNLNTHVNFILILEYIQNNYQTVTLASLAELYHYNPSYLSRMIKKNTGRILIDILIELKISKASALLSQTSLKIEEIANEIGYDNTDHFSKIFKKTYGVSPMSYRKAHQQS